MGLPFPFFFFEYVFGLQN